ncbi:MAG: hypothetical protein NVS2B12_12220 [Ktedonobacteraceae bacterium]
MFKTSTRYLIFLLCSLAGCIFFMVINLPGARVAQAAQASALHSLETPTATATNATVTIMQPGANGGTMGGHAGARVQIVGNSFQPGSNVNIYTTPDTTKCTADNAGNLQAFNPRTVTAKGDGTFLVNAKWPASSGQPGTSYYICAIESLIGTTTVSTTSFTVAQDVTVIATTSNVNPGDKVTITGSNWLPAQQLAVSITSNQGASSIVSGQTSSDANGNFSIGLAIPAGAPAGNYGVNVVAINEQSLSTYKDNVVTINASAQATPTVTVTPSPTAVPTAAATPAPTPTTGGNTGTHNSGSGSGIAPLTLLILALGGLGTLLVLVGLIMFVSYGRAV